ncbi:MAG: NDP-sugar synthase [Sandaracinaceae bacterium]|nr:NDP-sugar synthase [Sandaracinaceae bacterium]
MSQGAPSAARIKAMVFAAGLGTRLQPLTNERPKPGVPVANRTLASYSIGHLAKHGATRIVMNTHHLGGALPALLGPDTPGSVELVFVHEEALLGTGGGLRNAWPQLNVADDELVVVMNGDVIYEPDLAGAVARHRKLDAVATMVIRPDPNARRYGAIETDATSRVRRLLGKPESPRTDLDVFMFTGVHVLSPRAFKDLPIDGCIIRNSYRHWIDSGEVVAGFVDTSPWRDLGTLREYLDGNLHGRAGNLIDPSASVADAAVIEQSVIGKNVTVGADARLFRVVAWDNANINEELSECVVTATSVVKVPLA